MMLSNPAERQELTPKKLLKSGIEPDWMRQVRAAQRCIDAQRKLAAGRRKVVVKFVR